MKRCHNRRFIIHSNTSEQVVDFWTTDHEQALHQPPSRRKTSLMSRNAWTISELAEKFRNYQDQPSNTQIDFKMGATPSQDLKAKRMSISQEWLKVSEELGEPLSRLIITDGTQLPQ